MKTSFTSTLILTLTSVTLGNSAAFTVPNEAPSEKVHIASLSNTRRSWYDAQGINDSVTKVVDSGKGHIQCDGDKRVGLETEAFIALATKFCKDTTLDSSGSSDITPADAEIEHYEGYKFSFKWEKSEGECSTSCIDVFSAFLSDSVCSYDHHTKAASGSNKLACGTASFAFSNGKTPVSQVVDSEAPRSGCQSPDHSSPHASFKLAQSDKAISMWNEHNCLLDFSLDGLKGCTLYFNPCSKRYRERAVSVALTITMLSGNGSAKPTFEDSRDAFHSVISDCDTTTVDEKWGGWRTIERAGTVWMYNVTADQTGDYAPVSSKHKAVEVTSGPYCKKSWISGR